MSPNDRRRIAAVESLTRVRAGESREPDGRRVVWHQGARGADLLSTVDAQGRVLTQELTLLDDHFRWAPEGLRSGRIAEGGSSAAMKASALVSFDATLDRERVLAAAAALSTYGGKDRYLLHFRYVLERAAQGILYDDELSQVTSPGGVLPVAVSPPPARPPRRRWLVLAGVAAALAIAGAAAALISR